MAPSASPSRRGQVLGADLLVAIVLFTAAVAAVTQMAALQDRTAGPRALLDARRAATTLSTQAGEPFDWTGETVKVPGLALRPLEVDEVLLKRFLDLGAENASEALGVAGYHFYFEMLHLNGSVADANGTLARLGAYPPANRTHVAVGESRVRYRRQPVRLRVLLGIPRE
jgi:hypothetical protein